MAKDGRKGGKLTYAVGCFSVLGTGQGCYSPVVGVAVVACAATMSIGHANKQTLVHFVVEVICSNKDSHT
jgi:hypothetical protein